MLITLQYIHIYIYICHILCSYDFLWFSLIQGWHERKMLPRCSCGSGPATRPSSQPSSGARSGPAAQLRGCAGPRRRLSLAKEHGWVKHIYTLTLTYMYKIFHPSIKDQPRNFREIWLIFVYFPLLGGLLHIDIHLISCVAYIFKHIILHLTYNPFSIVYKYLQ